MVELRRYGAEVDSVFDLLGRNENDLTAAFAFTVAQTSHFLPQFLQLLDQQPAKPVAIRLEVADEDGRTDLEIDFGTRLIIVEAKRGLHLPTEHQLHLYSHRVLKVGSGILATLSAAPAAYAQVVLPSTVDGVPVKHVPWAMVLEQMRTAYAAEGRTGRRWLSELTRYLRKAIAVTDPASSWAYCVSVSRARPADGGALTFHDFVVKENTYFHPYGVGGWPLDPPTFMAFRWDNAVQQVRRVIASDVIPNLQTCWPDIPAIQETERPHAVYQLGPPLPMHGPLPCGTSYRAARFWVLVDQILTAPTLKDAREASQELTGGHAGSIHS